MVKKVLKEFKVEYLQVLDETGKIDEALMPKFSDDEIKKIYEKLILLRVFDQKAFNMQRQGRIGTYIQYRGQEASQLGTAMAMKPTDFGFPMYRSHAYRISRGHEMSVLLQYFNGDERGNIPPKGVLDFPACISVGTQSIHAPGAAWAAKILKKDQVSVVFLGDGATSKADFLEGMNFAGAQNLPCIFVVENNQFAISVPRSKQTGAETLAQKAIAFGFEGIQVDGMDIFGVYKVVSEAVKKARNGEGPTLIECYTYRLCDHSTSDDAKRYRDEKEFEEWSKKDAIERLEKYMKAKGLLDDTYKKKVEEDAKVKVEEAVSKFEKVQKPDPKEMFTSVSAELTPQQKEQMKDMFG